MNVPSRMYSMEKANVVLQTAGMIPMVWLPGQERTSITADYVRKSIPI